MILPLNSKLIPQITKIHINSLSNDFLPQLGSKFLETIYRGSINKHAFGYADVDNKKVRGFIVGTSNMSLFFRNVTQENFLKLSFFLFLKLLQKPVLFKKIFETFSYSKKDHGPKAELIVIAVSQKYRGEGIGKKLIEVLEKKFKQDKIREYKLTVHAEKEAVKFYEKLNFKYLAKFNLYNKSWFIYTKKLTQS